MIELIYDFTTKLQSISDQQRQMYFDNPELIVGKVVEVQYFRQSSNSKGGLSVSFPVFVTITDKQEVSYN